MGPEPSLVLPTQFCLLIFDPIDLAQGFRPTCVAEVIGLHYREAAQSPHFNR